jgi:hypothetical protein
MFIRLPVLYAAKFQVHSINNRMTAHTELAKIWHEMDMSYCKLPSHSLPGDTERNCEYVRIAELWAEIQTEDFPST